jgi:hypothetical protein
MSIVGKILAVCFIYFSLNSAWRMFKVGKVPVAYGLRPDWGYFARGLVILAVAATLAYFVFIR